MLNSACLLFALELARLSLFALPLFSAENRGLHEERKEQPRPKGEQQRENSRSRNEFIFLEWRHESASVSEREFELSLH